MKKRGAFYAGALALPAGLIFFVLHQGEKLQRYVSYTSTPRVKNPAAEVLSDAFSHSLPVFIMQLVTILVCSQVLAMALKKFGQPAVVAEIIAGIMLGPSLLGKLSPEISSFLFPATSLTYLQMFSQIGLILFMCVVGMELNLGVLKKKAGSSVVISHASIAIPFALGVSVAYFLYPHFAPPAISFLGFALFVGIAMSITAFPVLARIIKERKMTNSRPGTIALACAAADDITAWCLLSVVVAVVKSVSAHSAVVTVLLSATFILLMSLLVKPALQRLLFLCSRDGKMNRTFLAVAFIVLLLSSLISELIGIHALFGAFLAGIIMPETHNLKQQIISKTEDLAATLLLPLFFVFTGLRTELGLLQDINTAGWALLILALAIIGKVGGSALAARVTGEDSYTSWTIGILMNTRGLVELVVLNIGYDLGVLNPALFTLFVIMALLTTFMTNPLLNALNRIYQGPGSHKL